MRRLLFAAVAVLTVATAATAHMIYIVPNKDDATKAIVVFSDSLEPDTNVKAESFDKVAAAKLMARGGDGKEVAVTHTRDGHTLKVAVPAGTTVVSGSAVYGVFQRGEGKPMKLSYYPKAIIGAIPADGGKTGATVEIVPQVENGSVRFVVLAKGKPVAKAEVTVVAPGKEAAKVTTDDNGLTPATAGTGRYAAYVRHTVDQAGEFDGKKYEVIADYATLVVDVK